MKKTLYYVKIAAVLLVISSVTALMLAFVNRMTADTIEERAVAERNAAIAEIFDGVSETSTLEMSLPDGVNAVYSVQDREGSVIGYCVDVDSYGYGSDPINLLVGLDSDGRAVAVKVLSHSETPGVGSKATASSFLSQFEGKSGILAVKKDGGEIDAVAGATISSRAITAGVSLALSLGLGS